MITKDQFIQAVENSKKYNGIYQSDKFTFVDLEALDEELLKYKDRECSALWEALFEEDGVDWINWWIYEKNSRWGRFLEAKNVDGSIIPTETLDDLWELVKEYRK